VVASRILPHRLNHDFAYACLIDERATASFFFYFFFCVGLAPSSITGYLVKQERILFAINKEHRLQEADALLPLSSSQWRKYGSTKGQKMVSAASPTRIYGKAQNSIRNGARKSPPRAGCTQKANKPTII